MSTTPPPPDPFAGPPPGSPPGPPPGAPAGPPPGPAGTAPPPHPGAGAAFFDSLRRSGLVRTQDRWIGGVAGGIARRLGIDPLIVRGILVVLTLFGGFALVVYGLAWALLPEESDGRIHLQEAIRGRFDAALAGAAAFVVVGMARPAFWFAPDRWAPGWLVALAWVGVLLTVAVVAVVAASSRSPRPPTLPTQTGTPMSTPSEPGESPTTPYATGPTPYPAGPTPYPARPAPYATGPAPYPTATGTTPYGYVPPAASAPTSTVAAPPAPAWQPPPAPARRTHGPGAVMVGVVLALCFFGGAAVLLADRAGLAVGSVALTIAGLALVLLGLGVLVSGVRGRSSGVLGGLAILVALVAVPIAAVTSAAPTWGRIVSSGQVVAGDVAWTPTSVVDARRGYSFGVGDARVDLTSIPLDAAGTAVTVPIQMGAGSTVVVVPTGQPIEVQAQVGAGEIRSALAGDWTRELGPSGRSAGVVEDGTSGTLTSRTELAGTNLDLVLRSPAEGSPVLVVTIEAGFGDITIRESLR